MTPLTYFLNGRHKAGNNCRAVSFKDTQAGAIMSTLPEGASVLRAQSVNGLWFMRL